VVEVDFDPAKVSYGALLDAFFSLHDPTQLNRQGPDWGTQYRSAIFVHSPEQAAAAEAKIAELNAAGKFAPKKIATKIEPAQTFWRAEDYHQRYLEKRGLASCHI
jgi:peptide-methionine (S)-S-oxide reductase